MIYEMMRENHIFYQYHPPFVSKESILDDMAALPPGKCSADKFYIGFFEKKALVAVMDLIFDYPMKDIAYIGLFMTNTRYQNKGVGTAIISEVKQYLKLSGCKEIRLGVDKGNPQSYSFWIKNGFGTIGENEYIPMRFID